MATEVSWKTVALFQNGPKLVQIYVTESLNRMTFNTIHQGLENQTVNIVQWTSTKVT